MYSALREDILEFIKQAQERVLSHQEEQALLKAYIAEWRKFFTQCNYLPMPFGQLETALQGKTSGPVSKKTSSDESVVRKLMLDSWNQSIFSNIKQRLQDSAMKLVHAERTGEAFDSQLVSRFASRVQDIWKTHPCLHLNFDCAFREHLVIVVFYSCFEI